LGIALGVADDDLDRTTEHAALGVPLRDGHVQAALRALAKGLYVTAHRRQHGDLERFFLFGAASRQDAEEQGHDHQ
jgi:hypothetical protein